MVQRSSIRRWILIAAAMVFTMAAAPRMGADSTCPMPEDSCPTAMLSDCCCHVQQPAAVTALADAWSTRSELDAHHVSWEAATAGTHVLDGPVATFDPRPLDTSPPQPDLNRLSTLLI